MPLTLYNTLTSRKEPFEALDPTRVGLYVCGPTVYDRAHIGNARAYVVFDLLYSLLRDTYGQPHVRYVRNITYIEDKINAAARSRTAGDRARAADDRDDRRTNRGRARLRR